MVSGVACGTDDTSTPVASSAEGTSTVTPSASSPSATPSVAASTCKEAKAIDLSADDPFTLTVHQFQFTPDCFIADDNAAIAIENKDNIDHTFTIDGTLVNAPLRPHHTYKHTGGGGVLVPGTAYPFHCSIHPKMTGTWIVV